MTTIDNWVVTLKMRLFYPRRHSSKGGNTSVLHQGNRSKETGKEEKVWAGFHLKQQVCYPWWNAMGIHGIVQRTLQWWVHLHYELHWQRDRAHGWKPSSCYISSRFISPNLKKGTLFPSLAGPLCILCRR